MTNRKFIFVVWILPLHIFTFPQQNSLMLESHTFLSFFLSFFGLSGSVLIRLSSQLKFSSGTVIACWFFQHSPFFLISRWGNGVEQWGNANSFESFEAMVALYWSISHIYPKAFFMKQKLGRNYASIKPNKLSGSKQYPNRRLFLQQWL